MPNLAGENENKKKGLGRGLNSLLGNSFGSDEAQSKAPIASSSVATPAHQTQIKSATTQAKTENIDPELRIWKVAIDKLKSGEYQPRETFNKESLAELASSIRANGILQPIVARRTKSGSLEIVAGERRWRAAQIAGLHEVPVILKSYEDQQALELAIIENIQRENLNPIEEAEGYSRLIQEFKLSQQQVADKVGKDRATVANAVRILSLPTEVKKMIQDAALSLGHAKVLLSCPDPVRQIQLAKQVVKEKMSVRKLEKEVQAKENSNIFNKTDTAGKTHVTTLLIDTLAEEMQKILGTKVSIDYTNSKGKIGIHFYTDEQLTSFVEKLRSGWSHNS